MAFEIFEILMPWAGVFLFGWIVIEVFGFLGELFKGNGHAPENEHNHDNFFTKMKKKKEEKEKHNEERAPHLREVDHFLQGVRRTHLTRLRSILGSMNTEITTIEATPVTPAAWARLHTLAEDGLQVSGQLHGDFKKIETRVSSFDASRVRRFIKMGIAASELLHNDFDNHIKKEADAAVTVWTAGGAHPNPGPKLVSHIGRIKSAVKKIESEYVRLNRELVHIDKEARHELDAMHH